MDYKGASHQGEGNRQKKLEQQRKTMEEDNKRRKEQIIKDNSVSVNAVGERFTSQQEDYASALAKDTVGLVTLQEFEQKKKTQNASSAVKHANTAVLDHEDLLAVHTTYQGALTTVCYCATLSVFSCVELK